LTAISLWSRRASGSGRGSSATPGRAVASTQEGSVSMHVYFQSTTPLSARTNRSIEPEARLRLHRSPVTPMTLLPALSYRGNPTESHQIPLRNHSTPQERRWHGAGLLGSRASQRPILGNRPARKPGEACPTGGNGGRRRSRLIVLNRVCFFTTDFTDGELPNPRNPWFILERSCLIAPNRARKFSPPGPDLWNEDRGIGRRAPKR